jgi:pimeloyl-ACP methyl ester carboxylesterase
VPRSGVEVDVVVRSARLRARRWGSASATPVFCLPGLAGNVENFAFLAEQVAGPDRQLIALDLRGRGYSNRTGPGTYGWENHARDVLAVADTLGFDRFALVGQSMGGSVAMKVAELDPARLQAVVLVDIAGRVDRGIGPVIQASLSRLGRVYASADAYVAAVRTAGLIDPWSDYWERAYRYDLEAHEDGFRTRTSLPAVAEDRAYGATQDPCARWANLTMPTLLIRATRKLRRGAGHVIPVDQCQAFRRSVPHAEVVEVDGNHLTVNTHPDTAAAVRRFLERVAPC